MTVLSRRGFILGAAALVASPAIVKAENIMPLFVPKRSVMRDYGILADYIEKMVRPPLIAPPGEWMLYRFSAAKTFEIEWIPARQIYSVPEIIADDWTPKTIKAPPGGFKIARA